MVDWSRYNDDFLIRHFGLMALPYGTVWPDLIPLVRTLLVERMGKLPFLPDDWLTTVRYLHGKDGRILVPVPSTANHSQGAGPAFLQGDPTNTALWDSVVAEVAAARQAFASNQADQGRKLLERVNANARFWDNAYQTARVLALPVTVAQTAFQNPWTSGILLWSALGLVVFLALRRSDKG